MPLEIIVAPIVRESDGLAMSSRNVYLSDEQRRAGLVLSRSLGQARELIAAGERDAVKLRQVMVDLIKSEPLANIDYVEIVNGESLKPQEELAGRILIALAVRFGGTRLIDNAVVEV
jgi:pantoate--beta-alanine ligase